RQSGVLQPAVRGAPAGGAAGPSLAQRWLLLSIRTPLGPEQPRGARVVQVAMFPTKPPTPMPPLNTSAPGGVVLSAVASKRSTAPLLTVGGVPTPTTCPRSARTYAAMSFLTKLMSKLMGVGGAIVVSKTTVGAAACTSPAVRTSSTVRPTTTDPRKTRRADNLNIVLPPMKAGGSPSSSWAPRSS